jgi:hypothetical protein
LRPEAPPPWGEWWRWWVDWTATLALPAASAGSALGGLVEPVSASLRDVAHLVGRVGMVGALPGCWLASSRWPAGRLPGPRPLAAPLGLIGGSPLGRGDDQGGG